jgi:hypothetical protein
VGNSAADLVGSKLQEADMAATATPQSGTKDKNYDLITVTQLCLEHVWRLDQYARDAERDGDQELAALFRRMQEHSRRGAEESKLLMAKRLGEGM